MFIMSISKLGLSSFLIKGKKASLVTDPFNPQMVGLKFPQVEADIVTVSHDHGDHNNVAAVGGTPFVVSGPGEYEVGGVKILGIPTFHDDKKGSLRGPNTVYQIIIDGLVLVHLGDLGHSLSDSEVEDLEDCDILFVPTGGVYTLDAETASQVTNFFAPKIVIPMHYHDEKISPQIFARLSPVEEYLKSLDQEGVKSQKSLTISKEKLPEETTVIVLD